MQKTKRFANNVARQRPKPVFDLHTTGPNPRSILIFFTFHGEIILKTYMIHFKKFRERYFLLFFKLETLPEGHHMLNFI